METRKAFDYEQGQFITHPFAKLSNDLSETLTDLVSLLKQEALQNALLESWMPLRREDDDTGDDYTWHVTLLRGHRAIHKHQIRPLISTIRDACSTLEPFTLCLDNIDVFCNFERTKQFIVITERTGIEQPACSALRSALRGAIDKFAIKLTDEDETDDTRAHCSLLMRDIAPGSPKIGEDERLAISKLVEEVSTTSLDQLPIYVIRVEKIFMKIGNHVYDFKLGD